jgi:tRNA threonylcarbamoyladenosine biosynthesis protein TsaB
METLDAASASVSDVDLLAVAAGPGSFTGLRVGIATMQGLAMAIGRRIVAVSALDALARAGAGGDRPVAAWIDAQRGEVFAALYDPTGSRAVTDPTAMSPARTLDGWAGLDAGPLRFIGDGAVRYAEIIRTRMESVTEIVEAPPLAPVIGRLASSAPHRAVLPHAVVPIYIRRPDAELARANQGTER